MLFKTAILAGLGYVGYRLYAKGKTRGGVAFATGQGDQTNFSQVRDAGPHAMADGGDRWSKVDQRSDESFPASDPPSTY